MKTLYELLNNRVIVNSYDKRSDGSVMLRLDDRTLIVIEKGCILPDVNKKEDVEQAESLYIGYANS